MLADNLTWGGTYVADWDGFGTSPYTATDTSVTPNQGMQLFCLDFNDEIAPPTAWSASIMTLSQPNVAGTGAFAGEYAAQYGGDYNSLLTAAFNNPSVKKAAGENTAPQVSGLSTGQVPPFAFNGDTTSGSGSYAVTLTSQNPYTRYLEAAWLFTDIESALPGDVNTDMIAQAAAWELFVNNSNIGVLNSDIDTYSGKFVFNNYLSLSANQTYLSTATVSKTSTPSSGITFEQAVDAALAAAQNAVLNDDWGPGSYHYGSWSLVTGTPDYVIGYGEPVQEFLSPNAVPDQPPVPEPRAILLLGTIAALVLWKKRGWQAA